MKLRMVPVTPEWAEAVWDYRNEFLLLVPGIAGGGYVGDFDTFEQWQEELERFSSEDTVPKGQVPGTQFLTVDENDQVVGMLNLSHRLNDFLLKYGGNISYSVRPTRWREGIATAQLAMGLEEARKLGLSRVLIVCDQDNIASARTIQKNGGVLENEIEDCNGDSYTQRYWIDL